MRLDQERNTGLKSAVVGVWPLHLVGPALAFSMHFLLCPGTGSESSMGQESCSCIYGRYTLGGVSAATEGWNGGTANGLLGYFTTVTLRSHEHGKGWLRLWL